MKKALLTALTLLTLTALQAQVRWSGIHKAAQENIGTKIYFVDFYTDWCRYCTKMDRETFSDPTVAAILNQYYYPVKFNAETERSLTWFGTVYRPADGRRGSTHEFARGVRGFPTYVLFKADGSPLQSIPGFYNAHDFTVVLWYFASGDCDRYPFERYSQIFDKEIRPSMMKQLKQPNKQ
ncbi:MAG: thioredoxin family protein [Bacteroidales bacterium]|nr:thioredoxin family protein [Bacteroidales bacterium]